MSIKEKRTHGHGQQCGDCWGEGNIGGLSGNVKQYNKKKKRKPQIYKVGKTMKPNILLITAKQEILVYQMLYIKYKALMNLCFPFVGIIYLLIFAKLGSGSSKI